MAFKMKGFSGFKQSKADIINKYASGIGDAMAGVAGEVADRKKKKTATKNKEYSKSLEKKQATKAKEASKVIAEGTKPNSADKEIKIDASNSFFKMKGCPMCKGGKLKCTCSDNLKDGRSRSAAFQKYGCKKRG